MAKPRKPKNKDHKPENSDDAIVQHQKLCLAIDMDNRRIYGYTELKVVIPESGHVGLHADNMTIEAITVDGEAAEFELFPHYQFVDDESRWSSVSSATSASQAASSSLEMEMAPNLQILCKSGMGHQQQTDAPNNSHTSTELKQNVRLIRIDYLIQNPETGIHFRNNVVHTDNQIRRVHCWFPCVESSSQRCCYDLEFTVTQNLVLVTNGTLLYQVLSKDDPPFRTYVYRLGGSPRWLHRLKYFQIVIVLLCHICAYPLTSRSYGTLLHFSIVHSAIMKITLLQHFDLAHISKYLLHLK